MDHLLFLCCFVGVKGERGKRRAEKGRETKKARVDASCFRSSEKMKHEETKRSIPYHEVKTIYMLFFRSRSSGTSQGFEIERVQLLL